MTLKGYVELCSVPALSRRGGANWCQGGAKAEPQDAAHVRDTREGTIPSPLLIPQSPPTLTPVSASE